MFNPLVSLADTMIGDRARFASAGSPARALRRLDRVRISAGRPRRRGHCGSRRVLRANVRSPRRAVGRRLRRRRGPPLHAGTASLGAVPRDLRRQAHPAPRARDDRRGRGRSRPRSRSRSSVTGSSRRCSGARPPTSPASRGSTYEELPDLLPERGLCPRHLRNGRQGGSGDSQQGVPGDRLRRPRSSRPTRPPPASSSPTGRTRVLVPPGDATALADAVRRLAADPVLARANRAGGTADLRDPRLARTCSVRRGGRCSSAPSPHEPSAASAPRRSRPRHSRSGSRPSRSCSSAHSGRAGSTSATSRRRSGRPRTGIRCR